MLSGLIDSLAFAALCAPMQTDALVRQAEVLVMRYDKAVLMMVPAELPDASRYPEGGPSLIYIRDDSCHRTAMRHCDWLARIGVICAAFRDTPEQIRLAYLAAQRQAQSRLLRACRSGDPRTTA